MSRMVLCIYLDCQDLGDILAREDLSRLGAVCFVYANSCRRGLPWNQLSFIFCTMTLNYIYMLLGQKKAIDGFPIPCNKGFHAAAEAQTNVNKYEESAQYCA